MRGVGRAIIQGTIDGTVKIVSEVDGPLWEPPSSDTALAR